MRRTMTSLVILATAVFALGLWTALPAWAASLNVPANYATVQAAITAASAGDTVLVAPGTYVEDISLKSGVEVRGAGPALCTIRGLGAGPVVTANGVGSAVRLDGFTITGGGGVGTYGAGIRLVNSSPTISNNLITGNNSDHGGGIFCEASNPLICDNEISDNTASSYGGGISMWFSQASIIRNRILRNTAKVGAGGIDSGYNQTVSYISQNTIAGNKADYHGAGIWFYQASPVITNNVIVGNASLGGAVQGAYSNNAIVSNNTIANNATGAGIAAYDWARMRIFNCILWANGDELAPGFAATYSDIEDGDAGTGNISADPRFVDPAAGDFGLLPDSPCIDAGTNIDAPSVDRDGNPRPRDGDGDGVATVDVGAYEGVVVLKETIPPTTTAHLSGTSGDNGWYVSDVTVTLDATDGPDGSGVAETEYCTDGSTWNTYTDSVLVTVEGETAFLYRSIDSDGNIEDTKTATIKIDKTSPEVNVVSPADGGSYLLNQAVLADWSADDAGSGLAWANGTVVSGAPIDTASVGTKTFLVTACDNAGNEAVESCAYGVGYVCSGVLQPINTDGSSIFKLGRTVPVKFQLTDAAGVCISGAVARIYVAKISSSVAGDEVEGISTSSATEGNLFRYDPAANQYIFNWGTKGLTTGTWRIRIALDDGTSNYVTVSLR